MSDRNEYVQIELLEGILRELQHIHREAKMANQHLVDLQTSVTTLSAKVDQVLAQPQGAASEADLDAIKASVDEQVAKLTTIAP